MKHTHEDMHWGPELSLTPPRPELGEVRLALEEMDHCSPPSFFWNECEDLGIDL